MFQKDIILNKNLVAREAANFVYGATQIKGDIYIIKDERKINAKSLVGILSLCLNAGDKISVLLGNDTPENIEKVDSLFLV